MPSLLNEKSISGIADVLQRLRESDVIAVVFPENASTEIIGSGYALCMGLRKLGKTMSVFAPPLLELPTDLEANGEPLREFIISFDLAGSPIKELKYERDLNRLNIILSPHGARIRREDIEFRPGPLRYQLVITLDLATPEAAMASIPRVPELLYEKPVLAIGGHSSQALYAELNFLPPPHADTSAEKTIPELIYEILRGLNAEPHSHQSASALFVALAAATEHFRLEKTTAEAFAIAGELAKRGAEPELLHSYEVVRKDSFAIGQLTARAMLRARIDESLQTAWSSLTRDDFEKTKTTPRAVITILQHLCDNLPGIKRAILLWQDPQTSRIEAILMAMDKEERDRLLANGTIDQASRFITLPTSAPTFPAAEAYIQQLLASSNELQ